MQRRYVIISILIAFAIAFLGWRYVAYAQDYRLWDAARSGHLNTVQRLLDRGANPDASWQGLTALAAASFAGDNATASLLLAYGADPHQAWRQALHLDRPEILRAMLAHGLPVRGGMGVAVFLLAVEQGYADDVDILIRAGADPNAVEPGTGRGALQVMKYCSDPKARRQILRLLQRAGLHQPSQ